MNFFNDLSLKNKIFISSLGFILLVSILIALFTRSLLITSLTNELKKRGVGIAQGIADGARVHILTKNLAELTALAYDARLGNRKDMVKYLIISDNQGNILAHTFTTGLPLNIKSIVKNQEYKKENITSIDVDRHSVFHVVVPVEEGIYTIGSVQVGLDKRHIENLISDLRLVFLSFLSLVSIIFFFLSHRLALHITRPVIALIRYADQIIKGDFNIVSKDNFDRQIFDTGAKGDEITKLTNSFIKMTSQLIQASKMINLEKMSAGIAHEINQPLNAIKMGSEYLCMMKERKQKIKETDFKIVLEEISTQVSRAAEIVGRLKRFSRKADFSKEVINVNDCIRSVNKIIGRQIFLQNIDLIMNLDESVPFVLAHNNRVEQVLFNLFTNARDAVNERIEKSKDIEKGRITISTFSDSDNVCVVLSDNGTGIEPDQMDSIFESFYTTKEMGEGMGLGLPIVQGIVRNYNGIITVESRPGSGTSFKIMFPSHSKENE